MVTAGQAGDPPMLAMLLKAVRVGLGRPHTRPAAVLADKCFSSRAARALLRRRGSRAEIPESRDQQAHLTK